MYADDFRRKMKALGNTTYDRNMKRKAHEFELWFANTLDRSQCLIDGKETTAVFQDHSQSNNKDLSDDKYLIVPNDVEVGVGSYVSWDVPQWGHSEWLVFTEEHKTIPTHQQLKIKEVNKRLKWIVDYDGHKVCNNGEGWGAYVQNQTLYTLGVSFAGKYSSLINAKMMLYLQDNEETRKLKLGSRLFIGSNVYRIEFADNISRVGLINFLLDEDTLNEEYDNVELGIANYWNQDNPKSSNTDSKTKDDSSNQDDTKQDEPVKVEWKIEGSTVGKLGRTYTYTPVEVKEDGTTVPTTVDEWVLADIEDLPVYIQDRSSELLNIRVKDDRRYVGQLLNIMAKKNGEVKNVAVHIANKF